MKWGAILAITLILFFIALYEWPKINVNSKKDKYLFLTLEVIGWILAVLIVQYPDMLSPVDMINAIYKPLGKLLKL